MRVRNYTIRGWEKGEGKPSPPLEKNIEYFPPMLPHRSAADPFLTEPSMYQAMLQSTDYDIVVLGMGAGRQGE